jgi:hypothetical protein
LCVYSLPVLARGLDFRPRLLVVGSGFASCGRTDRLRLRGLSGASDEFTLLAAVQNLRRLAKRIAQGPPFEGKGTGSRMARIGRISVASLTLVCFCACARLRSTIEEVRSRSDSRAPRCPAGAAGAQARQASSSAAKSLAQGDGLSAGVASSGPARTAVRSRSCTILKALK